VVDLGSGISLSQCINMLVVESLSRFYKISVGSTFGERVKYLPISGMGGNI
jgi:hypothetical protein